jgi:outer membrane protein assembly factor BamB
MFRKIARALGIAVVLVIVAGAILYALGMRLQLDGGGGPHLVFVTSEQDHAAEIARHREAQRAQAPVVPSPAPDAPPTVRPDAPTTARPDAPAAATAAPAADAADMAGGLDRRTVPAAAPGRPATAYWTSFRGPARDGHYRQQPILTAWPAAGLRPLWKQPVGGGYASFAIARGRAFTIEQRAEQEVAAAYDVATGRELWTVAWAGAFRERMGGDGPRATPTWADGRVYVLGGTGELRAIDDATGKVVWRTNILGDAGASNLQWGMAASPLVVDNVVVVLPGGSGGRSVVAYDRETGKRVWSALDDLQSYSSPMLVTLGGVRQILVFSASRLAGISPGNGALLWEHPWKTDFDINASQPLIIGDSRVFISTGYGKGATVIELSKSDGGIGVREIWRNIRMKNQFTSSVLHDGFIYGLDESILACVDAATGDLKWKGGRYGYGQVLLASGHLIVLTEGGDLALVRATPERHEELVRFPAIEGKTWNHPAMSDGYLLVRNLNEMAAFDLRVPAGQSQPGSR